MYVFVLRQKMAESFLLQSHRAGGAARFLSASAPFSFVFAFKRKVRNKALLFGSAKKKPSQTLVCASRVLPSERNRKMEMPALTPL